MPRLCSVTVMEWTLSLPGCVHFLGVAESHLADVGGGLAEVAVGAWLRAMVPFTASELDQHRWPGPDPPTIRRRITQITAGSMNRAVACRIVCSELAN